MSANGKPCLSPEEVNSFKENGYIFPIKVFEPEEMEKRWKIERHNLMDRSKAVYQLDSHSGNTNIANYDRHLDSKMLAEHICSPEIVGRVQSVLGSDVLCWRSEFFPKYPNDEGTDWHQADTFQNASGSPQIIWPQDKRFGGTITVWTAFTEATIDMGCLQFIPGTQEQMFYDESKQMDYEPETINSKTKDSKIKRGFFGYDYRDLKIDPNWEPEIDKAISIELRPGEAVMFWSTLMHAAHPHAGMTDKMRLGFVGRYVPTCVHVYPDTEVVTEYGGTLDLSKFGSVLVSGENEYEHNKIVTETTHGFRFPVLR